MLREKHAYAAPREKPALLDVRQVAELLSCSKRTVQRLARLGDLPAPIRLASLVRWRRADIEAWFEARAVLADATLRARLRGERRPFVDREPVQGRRHE